MTYLSNSNDPRFDDWFQSERGGGDNDIEIELDVDDVIEDDYNNQYDEL